MKTGTPAAFFSDEGGRDIQESLISYIENFVRDAAGKRFNPHVTIGVGTEKYLNEMLAEPFPSFTFCQRAHRSISLVPLARLGRS